MQMIAVVVKLLTLKKNFCFIKFQMNRRYCENSMSKIQQISDPWGYIIFFKYETTLEKNLTNMQNFTLYQTNP